MTDRWRLLLPPILISLSTANQKTKTRPLVIERSSPRNQTSLIGRKEEFFFSCGIRTHDWEIKGSILLLCLRQHHFNQKEKSSIRSSGIVSSPLWCDERLSRLQQIKHCRSSKRKRRKVVAAASDSVEAWVNTLHFVHIQNRSFSIPFLRLFRRSNSFLYGFEVVSLVSYRPHSDNRMTVTVYRDCITATLAHTPASV